MWAGRGCQGGRVPDYSRTPSPWPGVTGEKTSASRLPASRKAVLTSYASLSFLGDESPDETVQSLGAEVAKEFLVPVPGEASQGKGIED